MDYCVETTQTVVNEVVWTKNKDILKLRHALDSRPKCIGELINQLCEHLEVVARYNVN